MPIHLVLEYVGSAFCLLGTVHRSWPKFIRRSLIFGTVGGVLLLAYSLITAQYGFSVLNLVSILSNIKGYVAWGKEKK